MENKSIVSKQFENRGVGFGDYIEILPVFGRKKSLKLNRVRFDFESSLEHCSSYEGAKITLPNAAKNPFKFSLILKSLGEGRDLEKGGRYILTSSELIKINGRFVYSAVVEKGDSVIVGYNKITFKESSDQDIYKKLPLSKKMCESRIPILLEGETGTGKTYLAKKIHEESGSLGRFVHINVSSFSKGLIESELFGHVKGAFTGASSDKQGALFEANRGTLFLDEIDSLPFEVQTKLLLFLDSGVIRPVGSIVEQKSSVRLICASGSSLEELVQSKKMRKDFFFRVSSGFRHKLKPLRKNKELVERVCHEFSVKNGVVISDKLISFYKKQVWPGNIRQLKFHLEKKTEISRDNILNFDFIDEGLQSSIRDSFDSEYGFLTLDELKGLHLKKVYFEANGKISECAKILGLTTNTVRSLLRKERLIGK